MQSAIYKPAACVSSQASYLPGHEPVLDQDAANDDTIEDNVSTLKFILAVLVNVVGGTVLLSAMFVIPQLIAYMFA